MQTFSTARFVARDSSGVDRSSNQDFGRRHQSALLLALTVGAIALRAVLAAWSPTPYGYVFDFYHEAIQKAYALGRLPTAADCWQCYHPPLLTALGLPLYAIGKALVDGPGGLVDPALRFVTPLALLCGGITAWFGYKLLRLFRFRGTELVIGTGLILVFPCLFISSYGIEADILLTALMTAFVYYLLRFLHQGSAAMRVSLAVGVLAGLACATKYSGLLAPVILVVTTAVQVAARPNRRFILGRAALALTVCAAIGSWTYIDNLRRYGTPLVANGSASQGFAIEGRPSFWRSYEFHTFRLDDLFRLARGAVPPGHLTDLPFYRSVWTTLHGMAWGDMGMFSDPSRHGFYREPYPRKTIDPVVSSAVLILGILPGALALTGFAVRGWHPMMRPLMVTIVITLAAYLSWVVAQESWALKTKYVLFLLPEYVVFALLGLRFVRNRSVIAARAVVLGLVLLLFACHLYLLDFAWS